MINQQEVLLKERILLVKNERLVIMKSRLLVTLLSVSVLTAVIATAPTEAANLAAHEENITQLKADDQRIEKLRHGYIKHDGNKVYYYW
ncbi:hypothetical protein [Sporomusa rhizae]|uniref:hypothetical protein n=1 Tax=Sporomusa rhizae TaxID=357999 RepID=UPI00352A0DC0